jgi:DNA-binding transcriptional LysR family regulator
MDESAMMDASLQQLRTFLRIVERGSLSAAARDLGTTQPTVSRQLQELEAAYGRALVIRRTRALRVTDAG